MHFQPPSCRVITLFVILPAQIAPRPSGRGATGAPPPRPPSSGFLPLAHSGGIFDNSRGNYAKQSLGRGGNTAQCCRTSGLSTGNKGAKIDLILSGFRCVFSRGRRQLECGTFELQLAMFECWVVPFAWELARRVQRKPPCECIMTRRIICHWSRWSADGASERHAPAESSSADSPCLAARTPVSQPK